MKQRTLDLGQIQRHRLAEFSTRSRRPWVERLRRIARLAYLRLVRQNDDPDRIGKGFGLGVFLGIFPTFGLGTLLALIGASWLKWNRAAAVLGTFIMNPLLNPVFLSLSLIVGNVLVPRDFRIEIRSFSEGMVWSGLSTLLLTYVLGNLVVSIVFSALAYLLAVLTVRSYRRRRSSHHV